MQSTQRWNSSSDDGNSDGGGAASAERGLNSTTRLALISSKWTSGSSCRTRTMDTFGQGGGPKKYAMLLCKFNCTIRARQGNCEWGGRERHRGRGEGGTHSLMNYVAANGPQMKSGHKCECECECARISSE